VAFGISGMYRHIKIKNIAQRMVFNLPNETSWNDNSSQNIINDKFEENMLEIKSSEKI
jgi:hypothetical protein